MRWYTVTIGELGKVVTGKTPKSSSPDEFGSIYPFITPSDMSFGVRNIETERFLSEKGKETHRKIILPKKSACVVCIGATIGKVCLTDTESFSNQQINSIVPNLSKADPNFIYYLTTLLRSTLENFAGGTATPIVNKSAFSSIKLLIPELGIQRKIAAILSAYDDLIDNNRRRIAILETMAEDIYREWFVRFRFPGYQSTEFEKGIPKGWAEGSLADIANILMGQSPKSEFYNTNGEGLLFHQGVGSYGKRFPINQTYCSVGGRIANEGEILFSVRAPVGRLNIADTKMIIGRGLGALSHRNGYNSYLFYLLKVAFANEDIIGNGAIFNSVGKDELKGFKLFLPNEKLVAGFEKKASVIDAQIKFLLKAQNNLEKTKSMLLPRLISGKLSVEHADIQFKPGMVAEDVV